MSDTSEVADRRRGLDSVVRWRYQIAAVGDAVLWALGLTYATWARFEFTWSAVDTSGLVIAIAIAVVAQVTIGYLLGVYVGRWKTTSFEGVGWLAVTTGLATVTLFLVATLGSDTYLIPRSAVGAGAAFQLIGAFSVRFAVRAVVQASERTSHTRARRMIVFGAGQATRELLRSLHSDPASDLRPVALLDDDPSKSRLRLGGVPVVGTREDIGAARRKYDASVLLIAIPSAPRETVAEIADAGIREGLEIKVLPRLSHLLTDPAEIADVREIRLSDFLSREEALLDVEGIRAYIEGKRVIVTGAAGSIGASLCEAILDYDLGQLLMLDISENGLHELALRLQGAARFQDNDFALVDVRDAAAVERLFREFRPQVVFHAAARKHVALLETHPEEAVRTNVMGTLNVLEAARACSVERVVNISTDKAADPVSVLGITKRIAERITAHYQDTSPGSFISVRFGNVLGSDGSVVNTFRHQLVNDLPLTITDREVTRYFMTIEEAIRLVIQAAAYDGTGHVLIFDMGDPVPILDLARRLAAEVTPGRPPRIVETGLQHGEKLHETLFADSDEAVARPHERLEAVRVPPLDPILLDFPFESSSREEWVAAAVGLASHGESRVPGATRPLA